MNLECRAAEKLRVFLDERLENNLLGTATDSLLEFIGELSLRDAMLLNARKLVQVIEAWYAEQLDTMQMAKEFGITNYAVTAKALAEFQIEGLDSLLESLHCQL